MRVTLLGTGTSFPDAERVQSGVLVQTESTTLLLDIGSGVLHRLIQSGVDIVSLDAVVLTHFHVDHCSDFMTLVQSIWLSGYEKTLQVYGPPAMTQWLEGVRDMAYPYLKDRIEINYISINSGNTFQVGDIRIQCTHTTHGSMDAFAYRLEYNGKSLVYTGDTAPCEQVTQLASKVDVLIHECNWLDGEHPEGVHTSPSEIAVITKETGAKKVILVHLSPQVASAENEVLSIVKGSSNAEVIMGKDLLAFDV
jgi:ribonuclease BN (tRNA processing enzyme)